MKKRLIKKQVKSMTFKELCECMEYRNGYWSKFAGIEFDKRITIEKLETDENNYLFGIDLANGKDFSVVNGEVLSTKCDS